MQPPPFECKKVLFFNKAVSPQAWTPKMQLQVALSRTGSVSCTWRIYFERGKPMNKEMVKYNGWSLFVGLTEVPSSWIALLGSLGLQHNRNFYIFYARLFTP